MYRYRDYAGSTFRSLNSARRNLHKVGELRYVKGYVYRGRYGITHVGVLVRGTKGSARFDGFAWGYSGSGPNGLREFLTSIGVRNDVALEIAHNTPWLPSIPGEKWRIDMDKRVAA